MLNPVVISHNSMTNSQAGAIFDRCVRFVQRLSIYAGLSPQRTAIVIGVIASVALHSAVALVGGIVCSALIGEIWSGIAGFCVALVSVFMLLIFSVTLGYLVKKLSCSETELHSDITTETPDSVTRSPSPSELSFELLLKSKSESDLVAQEQWMETVLCKINRHNSI